MFAAHLIGSIDLDLGQIPRRTLVLRYAEWCEATDQLPMRCKAFDRALKKAGFKRRRETMGERKWFYSLELRLAFAAPCRRLAPERIAA